MSRPKANTTAGRRATEKWRKTMIEKYGSEEAFKHKIRCMGSKGGRNGHTGGFAANRELARKAGRIGGLLSRRTGVKNGQGKVRVYYESAE